MKSDKKEHEHVYRRTIDESGEYHACECGYISRTPTIPEDSIHPPQSSNPDPAGRLKELAKKIRSYEESDKTVLNILEDFLDEHAGESAWEDAVKAIDRLVTEARIAELEVVKSQITEAHMILSPCGYRHTIEYILHPEIIEDRIAQLQSQLNKETT